MILEDNLKLKVERTGQTWSPEDTELESIGSVDSGSNEFVFKRVDMFETLDFDTDCYSFEYKMYFVSIGASALRVNTTLVIQ